MALGFIGFFPPVARRTFLIDNDMNAPTRDEMRSRAIQWLIEQYGRPIELDEAEKDRWHERCGLLYAFIHDHFPAENHQLKPTT